jgi:hypothetical protein
MSSTRSRRPDTRHGQSTHPEHIRKGLRRFGLKEGTNFIEYDFADRKGGLLFRGARNIDGRGFDAE